MKRQWAALGLVFCLLFGKAAAEDNLPNIRFLGWGGPEVDLATRQAAVSFQESIGKASVQWSCAPNRDACEDALEAPVGQSVDVVLLDTEMLQTLGGQLQKGYRFADLEQLGDVLDLNEFSYLGLEAGTVGTRLCAVPTSMTSHLLLWNETALKAQQWKVPQSSQEMAANLQQRKLEAGVYPLAADAPGRIALLITYLQSKYGQAWSDPATGKCSMDKEWVAEGLRYLQQWVKAGVMPPLSQQQDLLTGWNEGAYLGIWTWDSQAAAFQDALPLGNRMAMAVKLEDWGPYDGGFQKAVRLLAIQHGSRSLRESAMLIQFLLCTYKGVGAMADLWGVPDSVSGNSAFRSLYKQDKVTAVSNQLALSWARYGMPRGFEAPMLVDQGGVYEQVLVGLEQEYLTPEAAAIALISGLEVAGENRRK